MKTAWHINPSDWLMKNCQRKNESLFFLVTHQTAVFGFTYWFCMLRKHLEFKEPLSTVCFSGHRAVSWTQTPLVQLTSAPRVSGPSKPLQTALPPVFYHDNSWTCGKGLESRTLAGPWALLSWWLCCHQITVQKQR